MFPEFSTSLAVGWGPKNVHKRMLRWGYSAGVPGIPTPPQAKNVESPESSDIVSYMLISPDRIWLILPRWLTAMKREGEFQVHARKFWDSRLQQASPYPGLVLYFPSGALHIISENLAFFLYICHQFGLNLRKSVFSLFVPPLSRIAYSTACSSSCCCCLTLSLSSRITFHHY